MSEAEKTHQDFQSCSRLLGTILFSVFCACWWACGYVGDPQPPALMSPRPVEDLRALQRGEKIIVRFTAPSLTTEGIVLEEFRQVDLRIGAEGVQPFHRDTWEARASAAPVPPPWEPGPFRVELPALPWAGREVILGVRLAGPKGRWSAWSNLFALHVVQPLEPPEALRAVNDPEGVRLHWKPTENREGIRFRVLRRVGEGGSYSPAGETAAVEWVDRGTRYGVLYEYAVQTLFRVGDDTAESELTAPVAIRPTDQFAPPAPRELAAVAGLNTIELTWERVTAEDLAGYRVYRDSGSGEERIAEGVTVPVYSDRDVRSGVHYRYRVTAVDKLGNESEPSAPVEQTAP